MIIRATRSLCISCRIRFDHTSTFIKTSCIACPRHPVRWSGFTALQRGSTIPMQAAQDESPHYSERQLKSIYNDLFSSLPSTAHPTSTPDDSIQMRDDSSRTLRTLQERFGIKDTSYRAIIDHMQEATEFTLGTDLQLGLVLDTEWENIIESALDTGDLDYALKGLDILNDHHAGQVENLDLRLLGHPYPMQDVSVFSQIMGYPITPDRLSYLIDSHLNSHPHEQPLMAAIKSTQDLIHKLEVQGIPPTQKAYASVMRAYLDVSRDSNLLSEPTSALQTNPSAAIAAIHDLFTHMRYIAHPNPSLETYSLVIAACARGRQVNPLRALELLQEIKQGLMSGRTELIQPQLDVKSLVACYNGAIRACARAGARFAGDAFRLAKELVQPDGIPIAGATIDGVGPDRNTMTALMHSAKRIGDLARARWILTEVMRAQSRQFENNSEVILDEEIMVCAFQAYSAFRPAFRRGMTRNQTEELEDTTTRSNVEDMQDLVPTETPAQAYTIPQSTSEVLREADILLCRILSKLTESPDRLFSHVPISARIMNAYLGVYYSHESLERTLAKFEECHQHVEPNAYTFVNLLERLSRADEPDRPLALAYAKKTWINWQNWMRGVYDDQVDPVLAEATPRAIERAWAAIIRVHSLCDNVETALELLREFVTKYPPASLNDQNIPSSPTQRSRLEYPTTANSEKSLTSLLATPTPRVGLLVRFTTPEQITEPGIGPHLLFSDLTLLHQRLVSRHSHRKADIAFVTWACKSYELQLKRRRERALGVVKPPRSKAPRKGISGGPIPSHP
ncbi:unnamed protein product [Rhizoctonia solani]|uniref:Uncharacterized protein n=1 Tax=Rhizoctonia solani TaxID=456999 RepID=A0A8H2WDY8_9AGAM|nr:unnamed protein product [Rhizoctonia solani]